MAKNGSQALKQLGMNNPEWKTTEDDIPEDILIDHRVTVYIPIRDELDRAMSGLIQELNDEIVDKSIKDIETYIKRKITYNNTYYPFLSYKKIQTIEYFWRFIFLLRTLFEVFEFCIFCSPLSRENLKTRFFRITVIINP